VAAFAKNAGPQCLRVDYLADGVRLAFYTPDFFVRVSAGNYFLVETKGQVDKDVPVKARAAVEWCKAASAKHLKWEYLFVPEGVFQRFQGNTMAELARMCAPSLHDLLNEEKFREEMPLFAELGILEGKATEAQGIVDQKLLDALPDRLRKAVDESISLFGFFEKKQGVNYAPVFTALLGVIDETAKGLVLQKLTPKMPPNMQDQRGWFEPHYGSVEHTKRRHYEEVARNLRKTLVYKNGVSPLGLLRNCLDFALNDNTRLSGVFDAVKVELRFSGGRDLLDRVKAINEFRNTRVAHQETPLTSPAEAKKALIVWVDGLNRLWQAGRPPAATTATAINEHDIVSLIAAIPAEGIAAGARGTVVHLYSDGRACEVEFITPLGSKVVTLALNQIKSAN
jgi:type III restriction enzyme